MSMKKLMFTLLMCASLGFVGCGNDTTNQNGDKTCDPGCKDTEVCKEGQCKPKEQNGDPAVCDPACKPTEKCENGTCVPDTKGGEAVCGDGKVEKEKGETCDIAASILTQKCGGEKACTSKTNGCDVYTFSLGTAGNQCTEQCNLTKITEVGPTDDCCPEGATEAQDPDCATYHLCETSADCASSKFGTQCITIPGKKGYCGLLGPYDQTQPLVDKMCKHPAYQPISNNAKTVSACLFKCDNTIACPGDNECSQNGLCLPPKPPSYDFPKANADCTTADDCKDGLPEERKANVVCVPPQASPNPEFEAINQGGFCQIEGWKKGGFECPTNYIGATSTEYPDGICIEQCDIKDPKSVDKCEQAGNGNICKIVASDAQGKDYFGCAYTYGTCKDDTECTDTSKFTCESRVSGVEKHCYRKGEGTKANGEDCTKSEECLAGSYCGFKDFIKAAVRKDEAKFCTINCTQESDCTGIAGSHCVDLLRNGKGYCAHVTECTADTECKSIAPFLSCKEETLVGGGTLKYCSVPNP